MLTGKDTLLMRLQREMKEAPLPAPLTRKAEHQILADGYERQTDEEPIQMTEKYRHRTMYRILHCLFIALVLALLVFAVMKAGIINI